MTERGSFLGTARALLKELRPHQWAKNALVFVPPVAGHVLREPGIAARSIEMFAAFCATASGIYVINDLLDVEDDRRHPRKRDRPFASGALPLAYGWVGPALVLAGLAAATRISWGAGGLLLAYAVVSVSYSSWLKTLPLVDIFTLAALYMVRILGGGVATEVDVSIWLLGFSSFLFLALASLKRVAELLGAQEEHRDVTASRRGYRPEDVEMLKLIGVASTFASAVVLSLYVDSAIAARLYEQPWLLWPIVPLLLFWQCRLWLSAGRGWMHDDPLVFALHDWVSWLVAVCLGILFVLASGTTP